MKENRNPYKLEWSGLEDLTQNGFAFVRVLESDLVDRSLKLARAFYETPVGELAQMASGSAQSILGYFPCDSDGEEMQRTVMPPGVDAPARIRGYRSYDFLPDPHVLRAPPEITSLSGLKPSLRLQVESAYSDFAGLSLAVLQVVLRQFAADGIKCSLELADFEGPTCSLFRLLEYPGSSETATSKAHTDYEFISLVAATGRGLQVSSSKAVVAEAYAGVEWLTVTLGDMAEASCNGSLRSATHQVEYGDASRRSVVYFCGLRYEETIQYQGREIVFGEHLLGRLVRSQPVLADELDSSRLDLGFEVPRKNPFRPLEQRDLQ